jgi:hypothetical protein
MSEAPTINRTLLRRLELCADFPLEALEAVVTLRRRLEEIEGKAVQAGREKGATWEDLAEAMGVSRQAVYQKHRVLNGGSPSA